MLLGLKSNYLYLIVNQVLLLASLAAILVTATILNEEDAHRDPTNSRFSYREDQVLPKSKYYSNKKGTQVIEIGPDSDCHVHQEDDARWLRQIKKDRMTELNYFQFRLMMGKCRLEALLKPLEIEWKVNRTEERESTSIGFPDSNEFPQSNSSGFHHHSEEDEDDDFFYNTTPFPESPIPLIYPGTLWCGKGSAAKRTHDLGIYTETDKCCREHDQCSENMDGKSCKFGICNDSDYTRSHCDCDDRFRYCLQQDRSFSSFASFKIANLYFNILKPLCYAERPPVKFCRKHRITGECIDFEYNYEYSPIWQFFPAQPYPTVSDVVEKLINPQPPPPPEPPSGPGGYHPPPPNGPHGPPSNGPHGQHGPPHNGPHGPHGPPHNGPHGPPSPPHGPGLHGTGIRFPNEEEEEEENESRRDGN